MHKIKNYAQFLFIILVNLFFTNLANAQKIDDTKIKRDIQPVENVIDRIMQLKPVSYRYDARSYDFLNLQYGRKFGFLANDIALLYPELVNERAVTYMSGKNNYRTAKILDINYEGLIPSLVAMLQTHEEEIIKLKREVEALRKK